MTFRSLILWKPFGDTGVAGGLKVGGGQKTAQDAGISMMQIPCNLLLATRK